MCTLAQRFGRAARDPRIQGIGLLLVEPSIDDEEDEDIARTTRKRRRGRQGGRSKRARLAPSLDGSQSQELLSQVEPGPQDTSTQLESSQAESQFLSQEAEAQAGRNHEEEEDDIDVNGEVASQGTEDNIPKLHARLNEYNEWWAEKRTTEGGREPALRDLLHGVTPDINCRRVPWKLFFSDGSPNELGKLWYLFVSLMMPRRSHVNLHWQRLFSPVTAVTAPPVVWPP